MYLSRLTQDDLKTVGKYNGISFGINSGSSLFGNLVIGCLFATTLDADGNVPDNIRDITIWILAGMGSLGTLILAFLRFLLLLFSLCEITNVL